MTTPEAAKRASQPQAGQAAPAPGQAARPRAPTDAVRARVSDLQYLRQLWPYLWRQPNVLWVALVLYPLSALASALPPLLLAQMFDRGIAAGKGNLLLLLAGAYLASLVLEFVAGFASEYLMSKVGQRAMSEVRADLFAHLQKLPLSFFSVTPVGRLVTRVTSDVESLGEIFATGAISVVSDLLTVLAVVGMMLWLSPKLTVAAFLLVPLLLLVAMSAQRFARRAFQAIRAHLARINAFLAEHTGSMSVVQAFGQEQRTQAEFWQLNEAYRDANHRAIVTDATLYALVEAIGTGAVAATFAWGASDLSTGGITAGVLVAFIQYIRRFFVPIRDLSTKYTILQGAFAGAERIFSLLAEPVTLAEQPGAKAPQPFASSIELKGVSFRYGSIKPDGLGPATRSPQPPAGDGAAPKPAEPGTGAYVLQNISLTIHKGERIGLVGATGSGKTTLLSLLNRTQDVTAGQVLIDGQDVRSLKLAELRQMFAVVLQDALLFAGTLRDNLQLADRISAEAVDRALVVTASQALVASWPEGLNTQVGVGGENLSAGERQVLALVRAMALEAPLLLMDEATSHVDTPTEARLQQAMRGLLQDRTAVIVAHRLSTIREVDRIIVLDAGRIVDQGPPAELLARPGHFLDLVHKHDEFLPNYAEASRPPSSPGG